MLCNLTFDQPVGSYADVKELEYVTALMQSGGADEVDWQNPSIQAQDIQAFLMSRQGLQVEKQHVLEHIFEGLAGGDAHDDSIDIPELVGILIIPYLVKTVNEKHPELTIRHLMTSSKLEQYKKHQEELEELAADSSSMISLILNIVLHHATGSTDPQPLTKELLKKIFASYDELGLVKDESLLEEMIQVATDGEPGAVLDDETFARGLTDDVGLYDVQSEARVSTHYQDAFDTAEDTTEGQSEIVENVNDEEGDVADDASKSKTTWTKVFTFSQLDFLSGTFRTRFHYMLAWLALILAIVAYTPLKYNLPIVCDEDFGCLLGKNILDWLVTLLIYVALGTPFVTILTLGNDTHTENIWIHVAGLIGIGFLVYLPAALPKFDLKIGENFSLLKKNPVSPDEYDNGQRAISLANEVANYVVGGLIFPLQVNNILSICKHYKYKIDACCRGSSIHDELKTKTATRKKVYGMMKNAYELHKGSSGKASRSIPLLNYNKISGGEVTKSVGGLKWALRSVMQGTILSDEGVWIPARLVAGNIAQFLIICTVFSATIGVISIQLNQFSDPWPIINYDGKTYEDCHATFNASSCSYPVNKDTGKYYGAAICPDVLIPSCILNLTEELGGGIPKLSFCALIKESSYAALYSQYIDEYQSILNFECPTLSIPISRTEGFLSLYAFTEESNEEDTCSTKITAFTTTGSVDDEGNDKGMMILGIDTFLPNNLFLPKYSGDLCDNYDDIRGIQEEFQSVAEVVPDISILDTLIGSAAFPAFSIAFILGIVSSLGFIPSVILIMLKLRTGVIPTVRNYDFMKYYRENLHRTTGLFGAMFYGAIASYFAIGLLLFTFIFLTMWSVTRGILIQFWAGIVAVAITVSIRMFLINNMIYKNLFQRFYRVRNPAVGNVVNLALECWDLGITSGFILVRLLKVVFTTFLFMGRLDIPLLSDTANRAGVMYIDTYPMVLRLNLLAIDAHRHPYIERLGLMCMMKLRHGTAFGKKSGSTWRLLYVFALMPWLRKYRISSTGKNEDIEEDIIHEIYGTCRSLNVSEADLQSLGSRSNISNESEKKSDISYSSKGNDSFDLPHFDGKIDEIKVSKNDLDSK